MDYKLNIDTNYNYLFIVIKQCKNDINDLSVCSFFANRGDHLITFEKPEVNPHYHIILKTKKDKNAIRNAITRKFKITGGMRTVADCKEIQNAIPYIMKEFRIKKYSLFNSDEQYQYYRDKALVTNKEVLTKKSIKQNSFKWKFVNEYEPLIEYSDDGEELHFEEDHINKYIVKMFKRECQLIDKFIYHKFYHLLELTYYPTRILERMQHEWRIN